MSDEPKVCPRCTNGNLRRRYYRPGLMRGGWKLFACWRCGACQVHLDYKPFLGEITPGIKVETLTGEMEEAVVALLQTLEAFRRVGQEMGVWTPATEEHTAKLEAELLEIVNLGSLLL